MKDIKNCHNLVQTGGWYKMSAENEFWRQNKAARAAPVYRNGVPKLEYEKMFSEARGRL